jgi:hypothetical protein
MTDDDRKFALRAIGRKRLFLGLSIGGLVVAFGLAALYGTWFLRDHAFAIGPRAVIILLILLNARQNLRQFKFARILEGFMAQAER